MSNPKTKHTPGPWTVGHVINPVQLRRPKVFSKTGPEFFLIDGPDEETAEANARLIAAAPDCLKALELILDDDRLMNAMKREQARAILDAVRKATGGES